MPSELAFVLELFVSSSRTPIRFRQVFHDYLLIDHDFLIISLLGMGVQLCVQLGLIANYCAANFKAFAWAMGPFIS